jgi:uncharacterized membrane protein YeaQ/YmgE (transglycosylase-associated protein family)
MLIMPCRASASRCRVQVTSNVRPHMNTVSGPRLHPDSRRPLASITVASALWLVISVLAGFLAARLIQGHGSIVFTWLGWSVGIAGAVAHASLLSTRWYHPLPFLKRSLSVWLATMVALVVLAFATSVWSPDQPAIQASFYTVAGFALFFAAVPSLIAAPLFVRLAECGLTLR